MSDAKAERSGASQWSTLIGETRQALSELRVEEIEELRARAECMLSATVGHDSIRQGMPRLREDELLEVTREHGLLLDLLVATDRNLKVLRCMRVRDHASVGEANSRWER